jgi:hypothetical protein
VRRPPIPINPVYRALGCNNARVACTVKPVRYAAKITAPGMHTLDHFIGRQDSMGKELVVDHRRLIALPPNRMPRSRGCVLYDRDFKTLFEKVAQMRLDANVCQHAS